MDNPQHYQPLSHALHPPSSTLSRGLDNQFIHSTHHTAYNSQKQAIQNSEREEEEEEEEDDDDEGLVEEQLNQNDVDMHGSDHGSPQPSSSAGIQTSNHGPHQSKLVSPAPEKIKRRGRPRGSKNRRALLGSAKHETQLYHQTPAPNVSTPAPQHANISPQNQHYYEFQWRVLNLCAEFYGAAEELVKGTSPLVIAQCYSMGPGIKIDPLAMLTEAKRVCDALLSNPSQLVTNPPPPVYPVLPTIFQSAQSNMTPISSNSITSAPSSTAAPSSTSNTSNVITNPQTFVVPLGVQPPYTQYSIYAAAPGPYPAAPYYQYPAYGQPGVHYAPPPQPMHPSAAPLVHQPATPPVPLQQTTANTNTPATGATVIGNQGPWSDEETERLKKLAEESRSKGSSGGIEWEWVIQQWGIGRTRHQILVKATAMGLKESSTRATKRRRDADESTGAPPPPMASLQQPTNPAPPIPPISSPAQSTSQATSTPAASPAMQNQQRPSSSKGLGTLNPPAPAATLPWPMPTVAVNTPSPVISTSVTTLEQQRSSYYRPRPTQDASSKPSAQPSVQHPYMYTASGQVPPAMRPKENGN